MVDWKEAGRKADAHRIRDRYRAAFNLPAKAAVRHRVIDALRAAGGETVLDLWGGGLSASAFVTAGFRVISVDDGSLELMDHDRPVSAARKRRALEYAAAEGGYEARWGKVAKYATEADVAFLDFCGPWSREVRKAVEACRHMKAVVVTLMPDHDMTTDATTVKERRVAYEAFLSLAFSGVAGQRTGAYRRRLCLYRRPGNQSVFVHMVSKVPLKMDRIDAASARRIFPSLQPSQLTEAQRAAQAIRNRKTYERRKPEINARRAERERERRLVDPVYRALRVSQSRHRYHVRTGRPKDDCGFCVPGDSGSPGEAI